MAGGVSLEHPGGRQGTLESRGGRLQPLGDSAHVLVRLKKGFLVEFARGEVGQRALLRRTGIALEAFRGDFVGP